MELDNRVRRSATGSRSMTKYLAIAFFAGVLAACTPAENDAGTTPENAGEKTPEKLAILITLDVGQQPGSTELDLEALSKTRAEIVKRLKETIAPAAQDSIRTFENLPAIAVSVDPTEVATILGWLEIKTIERDRTFELKNATFK